MWTIETKLKALSKALDFHHIVQLAGFDVKSETESLNRFIFGFGPNPEVKYPNPESFKKGQCSKLTPNKKN